MKIFLCPIRIDYFIFFNYTKSKIAKSSSIWLAFINAVDRRLRQTRRRAGLFKMMSKEDRNILKEFSGRVRDRFSDARVWAFGSRARGEATWESDFDIFIVLNEADQKIDRWIRDIAWEVGFKNERVITTVLLDKVQFEHGPMSESTIVDNVLREGISA